MQIRSKHLISKQDSKRANWNETPDLFYKALADEHRFTKPI